MRRQTFRQSTAATISFTPSEGPPITSATVVLYEPGGGELQASASATMPTVDTTISGAVTAGDSSFTLADGTSVARRTMYWCGDPDTGPLVPVVVKSISGAVVTLSEPVPVALASGVAFKGGTLTYSLTTTHTATLDRNYRARWSYTVGSDSYTAEELFDVVKHQFKLPITEMELMRAIPNAMRLSPKEVFDLQDLLDEVEDSLANEIESRGLRLDLVRSPHQFRRAGLAGVRMMILDRAAMIDPGFERAYERAELQYQREIGQIFAGGLHWYDADEDDSIDGEDEKTGLGGEEDLVVPDYFSLG